jgi:hypothetical protein
MQISKINDLIEESDNKIFVIVANRSQNDKMHQKQLYRIFKQITNQLKSCDDQVAVKEFRNNILSLNKYDDEIIRIQLYQIILYILYLDLNGDNINHTFVNKMFNVFRNGREQYGGATIAEISDRLLKRLKHLSSVVGKTQDIFPKITSILNSININGFDNNIINVKIILSELISKLNNMDSGDTKKFDKAFIELDEIIQKSNANKVKIDEILKIFISDKEFFQKVLGSVDQTTFNEAESASKAIMNTMPTQFGGGIRRTPLTSFDPFKIKGYSILYGLLIDENYLDPTVTKQHIDDYNFYEFIEIILGFSLEIQNLIETINNTKYKIDDSVTYDVIDVLLGDLNTYENYFNQCQDILNDYNAVEEETDEDRKQNLITALSTKISTVLSIDSFSTLRYMTNIKDYIKSNNTSGLEDLIKFFSSYRYLLGIFRYEYIKIKAYKDFHVDRDVDNYNNAVKNKLNGIFEIFDNNKKNIIESSIEDINKHIFYSYNNIDAEFIQTYKDAIASTSQTPEYIDLVTEELKKYNSFRLNYSFPYIKGITPILTGGVKEPASKLKLPSLAVMRNTANMNLNVALLPQKPDGTLENSSIDLLKNTLVDRVNAIIETGIKYLEVLDENKEAVAKYLNEQTTGGTTLNDLFMHTSTDDSKNYGKIDYSESFLKELLKWKVFTPKNIFDTIKNSLNVDYQKPFDKGSNDQTIIEYVKTSLSKMYPFSGTAKVTSNDFKTAIRIDNSSVSLTDTLKSLYGDFMDSEATIDRALSITQEFDKTLTLALNAIKVYVKMRAYVKVRGDKTDPRDKYGFDKPKCISHEDDAGNKTYFGEFTGVVGTTLVKEDGTNVWKDGSTKDLHCGIDKDCNDKSGLSGGTKDVASQYTCIKFTTVGISGAGKSGVLFGGRTFNENDRKGLVSRIISDVLSKTNLIGSFTDIKVKLIIGEAYGEKLSYDLNKTDFMECFILWKLGGMNIKGNESRIKKINDSFDSHNTEPGVNLRTYFTLPNVVVQIEQSDKGKEVNKIRNFYLHPKPGSTPSGTSTPGRTPSSANFEFLQPNFDDSYLDDDFYKKFIKFVHDDDDKVDFISFYKSMCLMRNTGSQGLQTLYDLFTDSDESNPYYYTYESKVGSIDQINKAAEEFTYILETIYDKITEQRKLGDFIRCTINNPESSRSHLIFGIETDTGTEKKYFIFVDQAGNESPYYIAFDDLKQIQLEPPSPPPTTPPSTTPPPTPQLFQLFKQHQVTHLLNRKASEHYNMDTLNISVSKLFAYTYLHHRIYKKIKFVNKETKCNSEDFFKTYAKLAETFSFLFLNDLEFDNEVTVIGDIKPEDINKENNKSIQYKSLNEYFDSYRYEKLLEIFNKYKDLTVAHLSMRLIYFYNYILFYIRFTYYITSTITLGTYDVYMDNIIKYTIIMSYYSMISKDDEIIFMKAVISLMYNTPTMHTKYEKYLEQFMTPDEIKYIKDIRSDNKLRFTTLAIGTGADNSQIYPKMNTYMKILLDKIVEITNFINILDPTLKLHVIDDESIKKEFKQVIYNVETTTTVKPTIRNKYKGIKDDLNFDTTESYNVLTSLSNNYKSILNVLKKVKYTLTILKLIDKDSTNIEYVVLDFLYVDIHGLSDEFYVKTHRQQQTETNVFQIDDTNDIYTKNYNDSTPVRTSVINVISISRPTYHINDDKLLAIKKQLLSVKLNGVVTRELCAVLVSVNQLLPNDAKILTTTGAANTLSNKSLKNDLLKILKEKYDYTKSELSLNDRELNDKLLNDYLLNGLQGFWINHSNRFHVITDALLTNKDNYDKYVSYFKKWEIYNRNVKRLRTNNPKLNDVNVSKAINIEKSINLLTVEHNRGFLKIMIKKTIGLINLMKSYVETSEPILTAHDTEEGTLNTVSIISELEQIKSELEEYIEKLNKNESLLEELGILNFTYGLVQPDGMNIGKNKQKYNDVYETLKEIASRIFDTLTKYIDNVNNNSDDPSVDPSVDPPVSPPVGPSSDSEPKTTIATTVSDKFTKFYNIIERLTGDDDIPEQILKKINDLSTNDKELFDELNSIPTITLSKLNDMLQILTDGDNFTNPINETLIKHITKIIEDRIKTEIKKSGVPSVPTGSTHTTGTTHTPVKKPSYDTEKKILELEELINSPEEKYEELVDRLKTSYTKNIKSSDGLENTPIGEIIKTTKPFPVFMYKEGDLTPERLLTKTGETFQNNYLSKYDIRNNLWLILLYTIHHLGANKVITKYIKPVPSDKELKPLTDYPFNIKEYFTASGSKKNELTAKLEQIKDYYLTARKTEISSARVIILAATNEEGKQGQVIETFKAAQSLARLTGKACDMPMAGGGYEDFNHLFKKSYHTYINGLNKRRKKRIT